MVLRRGNDGKTRLQERWGQRNPIHVYEAVDYPRLYDKEILLLLRTAQRLEETKL